MCIKTLTITGFLFSESIKINNWLCYAIIEYVYWRQTKLKNVLIQFSNRDI